MLRIFSNRRLMSIAIILIASNLLITGISLVVIYKQSISTIEETLTGIVERNKTLDIVLYEQGKSENEIIQFAKKMCDRYYSLGKSGEFVIARKQGDSLKILLALGVNPNVKRINIRTHVLPIHLALSGNAGFVKREDYQGKSVFASYTFVPGLNWGIVAKIPASEVYKPYLNAALITLIISVLLIVFCIILFIRFSNPIIKTLVDSEETYRMLFDSINDAVFISEVAADGKLGKFIKVNDIACEYLGYTREELLNKTPFEINSERAKQMVSSLTKDILVKKHAIIETEHVTKDGRIIPVEISTNVTQFKNKTVFHSIARDITDRKMVEHELKEKTEEIEAQSEEYLQINEELTQINVELQLSKEKAEESALFNNTLMRTIPFAIDIVTDEGEIIYQNDVFKNIFGEEAMHKKCWDVYRDDKTQCEDCPLHSEIQIGQTEVCVSIGVMGGKTFEVSHTGMMFQGKKALLEIFNDITQRKKTEQELIKSETLTRTAVENLPIIFYMIDKDGIFRLSVGAGLKSLGLQPNQVVGLSVFEIYKDYPVIINAINKALSGEPANFESNVNEACHLNIVTPFFIAKQQDGIVGVALDITERKKVEEELIKAKDKAEESDRLKTAFLQNMSHEIRTPMNAIMGFSELLAINFNNKPKIERYSEIINLRCNDLLDIVNDILDIAKIESGQLPVSMEECNLHTLFVELSQFYLEHQKRMGKQQITFHLKVHSDVSGSIIITDKVKLKQIYINLISNAFKFTEVGTIEGGCKYDKNGNLLFYVSDTGIGIPKEKQQLVFERFAQVEQGSSRLYGGTGLGLSIVKGLVGLLGGEIFLQSELGKGSTFSFTIPYKTMVSSLQYEPVLMGKNREYDFSNKTILIVEDDLYNAEYIKELLTNKNLNILHTEYGIEAINISISQPIDLVLMDIRLSDMDGYEATRQIRQHKSQLKIIAQTAYASNDEGQKALNAGCNDYISKPLKKELLLAMISKHL